MTERSRRIWLGLCAVGLLAIPRGATANYRLDELPARDRDRTE